MRSSGDMLADTQTDRHAHHSTALSYRRRGSKNDVEFHMRTERTSERHISRHVATAVGHMAERAVRSTLQTPWKPAAAFQHRLGGMDGRGWNASRE